MHYKHSLFTDCKQTCQGQNVRLLPLNIAEFRPRAIWMFNACTNQCAAWFFYRIIIWAYTFARECSPGIHCFQDVQNRPPTHRLLITLPINGMAVAKTTYSISVEFCENTTQGRSQGGGAERAALLLLLI